MKGLVMKKLLCVLSGLFLLSNLPLFAYYDDSFGGLGQNNINGIAAQYDKEQALINKARQAAGNDPAKQKKINDDIRAGVYGPQSQQMWLMMERITGTGTGVAPTGGNYNSSNTNHEAYYRCKASCESEANSCMQSARYNTDTVQRSQAMLQCSQYAQICRSNCQY